MTKWIVPIIISAICAFSTMLWQTHDFTTRKVIYIRGGKSVLADSVKESAQFVYYKVDGKSGMFMKDDVTSIGSVEVERKMTLLAILNRNKNQMAEKMGSAGELIRKIDGRLIVFLVLLPIWIGCVRLMLFLSRFTGNGPKRSSGASAPNDADENQRHFPTQESHEHSELRDIVLFFTELYRLQNDLPDNTPTRFKMTSESAGQKMKVFELSLKGSSDWLTRRMSIGPLGEETGSKSKCFYVIYDTHMVVKIPPVPVTDIEKYTTDIRREVKIATQLTPLSCIIPMVSVVLKKIKTLPYAGSLTTEQLEKRYLRLVEESPEYQDYLTIGGRFAFFMELSNSFFLGRVIDELHDAKQNIAEELHSSPDIAWNQAVFTSRYGIESLPVFEGLQSVFHKCEAEAKRILTEKGQKAAIHDYQVKNWFLTAVSGNEIWDPMGVEPELVERIKAAFTKMFEANETDVDALTRLLKQEQAIKSFSKNRNQIENIASNMLQLLDQLREKQVALRDLKPDNLFLDADPDAYPVFLNDWEAFSIGVIDVETAVSLEPTKDGRIAQPLLGGTPLYATPLHVLKNETIATFFGNPSELLHLEDWFATIAIIFKTITGANLFPRAARSFPGVLKILKSGRSKSNPSEETVKAMSQQFWSAAATDMKSRLHAASATLRQLNLRVPAGIATLISAELDRQCKHINQTIQTVVNGSPLLRRESNKAFLLKASTEEILHQQERWRKESELPEAHQKVAPRMIALLDKLHRLKQNASEKQHAAADLSESIQAVSAHILLDAMFQIVFRRMYRANWDTLTSSSPPAAPVTKQENKTIIPDAG